MKKLAPASFTLVLVTLTVLSLISGTVRCQTVLVPSRLHVGENNTLLLISESDSSATLNLYEKGQSVPSLSQQVIFQKGQLVESTLFLDHKIATDKVSITLNFPNGAKSVEDFEVSPINGFVFFQTDKPIYRVSETVRFRILRLDRSLGPINEKVVLKIQNHQKIKVDEVSLQTKPPLHIAEHSFTFPLIAKPGTWSAEINYGPNLELKQSTTFDVTEYVLPLFKTEIQTSKFIFESDEKTTIGVKAFYTFGKPVRGTLHFRFGIEVDNKVRVLGSSNTFCFDNGTFSYPADLISLHLDGVAEAGPVKFVVEAVVKECASGTIERTQDKRMLVVRKPYSLSLRKTIRKYKRMVNNYIMFEIVNPQNEPVANVPINLTMTTKGEKEQLQPYIVSMDSKNDEQSLRTDKEGKVVFLFQINKVIGDIKVEVKTADLKYTPSQQMSDYFTIVPFNMSEPESVWIENKKRLAFSTGERFQSPIKVYGDIESFYLAVMSKGAVIYKQKLALTEIDFEITNRMVPSVRVLLIAFTASGHTYVADSVRLDVHQARCGVSVGLETKQTIYPGESVTFSIKGNVGDVVAFQAVDEAIYVLRNEKNASLGRYEHSLKHSDSGCGPGGGINTFAVIRTAGFKVLSPLSERKFVDDYCKQSSRKKRAVRKFPTNTTYLKACCEMAKLKTAITRNCEEKRSIVLRNTDQECADEFYRCCRTDGHRQFQASVQKVSTASIDEKDTRTTSPKPTEDTSDGDASLVRTDFRDTWLFDLILLKHSEETLTRPSPHSITSWVISAMSISQKHGFCLDSDQRVTTFKPFFIHVAFPQTIVQHEQTEISVTIFNYLGPPNNKRLTVRVTFYQVKNICGDGNRKKVHRNFSVDEMSSERVAFPIVPLQIGVFQIQIKATTPGFTDTVIRNLTVLAPGIEIEKQLTFDLDPLNRAKRDTRVVNDYFTDITNPSDGFQRTEIKLKANNQLVSSGLNIVPKTLHYVVTAVGERFSPQVNSIETLSGLIKKPKGCGEQNMYYMSFNLYTLMYLEKIGKLSTQLREKGVRYLKRAFAQELNFRKDDGSFSAFYKRDSSIWLTAFVAKVLCQSGPFIGHEMDSTVILSALRWLQSYQSPKGDWKEMYPILHEKALGGVQGVVPLTSYLMVAFNECRNYIHQYKVKNSDLNLEETIRKANAYILEQLNGKDSLHKLDYYSLALIAYSLSYCQTSDAIRMKERLVKRLLEHVTIEPERNYQYWKTEYPVETASYALMAIIKTRTDILEYIAILNWLSSQQKNGTFDNTQDTIVALEALSKYYALYKEQEDNRVQLHTNVTFNSRLKRSLIFDNNNADVLQTIKVDNDTKEIEFNTTGNGLGKVNLLIIYNEYSPNSTCPFTLDVNVYEFKSISPNVIPVQEDHEVDYDKLFTNPQKMFTELTVKESFENKRNKNNYNQRIPFSEGMANQLTNCCSSSRLAKRSIGPSFWKNLANSLSIQPTSNANVHSKRSEPKQTDQPKLHKLFPSTPNLGDNPVILVLDVCVRHATLYIQEMAILEVTILSGFKPIEEDLKRLKANDSSFIEHYDISNSKVTFYFRQIPHARIYCLLFRIYQEHMVDKIQSALVRIYSYYNQEWTCTRLYSNVRKSNFLDVKCKKEDRDKCKCITDSKCPENNKLKEILKEANMVDINKSKDLFCEYSNVFTGTIINLGNSSDSYSTPFLRVKVQNQLIGDIDEEMIIRFNPECAGYAQKESSRVIIMHNPDGEDQIYKADNTTMWLLEGGSIFMALDGNTSPLLDKHFYKFGRASYDCLE